MDKENKASGCYTDSMKGISTDRFSLEYFITNDLLYVDKTMYAYELISSADKNFFFISRPRRFGKSLFCSTLHSIFDGKRDLFKGLYIAEKTDYSFEKYPVIHLDFSKISLLSEQAALNALQKRILGAAEDNGISIERDSPSEMLDDLIMKATRATGKQVVIIIDEFDSPFTSKISWKPELIEYVRELFNEFYKSIKADSAYIRFFFMTGCVRLSNLSIFSAMNNLYDISMDRRFAGAFGYTEKELEDNFGEGMDEYLEANPGIYGSKDEFIGRIRDYYDGYRFSPDSEVKVYNPVSIGRFFDRLECKFDNYWEKTGSTSMVVQAASKYDLSSLFEIENETDGNGSIGASISAFSDFSLSRLNDGNASRDDILALLYFSGYLTLIRQEERSYILGFPNFEVRACFVAVLLSSYTKSKYFMDNWMNGFKKACATGDITKVMDGIDSYFQGFSYDVVSRWKEATFQGIFHSIFICNSMFISSEVHTLTGRIDEVMIAGNHIWIFELKTKGSAKKALEQIKQNRYDGKYLDYAKANGLTVHLVGISIDTKTRKLSWIAE